MDTCKTMLNSSLVSLVGTHSAYHILGADPNDYVETIAMLESYNILLIGAGGLGCEALKNLIMSGFRKIHIIDPDLISKTNLQRQFLFTTNDVGKPKSKVAAEYIQQKYKFPTLDITWAQCRIEDYSTHWVTQFDAIVLGLDSMKSRLYVNWLVCEQIEYEYETIINNKHCIISKPRQLNSCIPIVDGGSEGLRGTTTLTLPGISPCIQCISMANGLQIYIDANLQPVLEDEELINETIPLCTVAEIPRLPIHCVIYAELIQWPKLIWLGANESDYEMNEKGNLTNGLQLDRENPTHLRWIHKQACIYANKYDIDNPTMEQVMETMKKIIPAVSSTNSLVSALGIQELLKFFTASGPDMNRYFLKIGDAYASGLTTNTLQLQKNAFCVACSGVIKVPVNNKKFTNVNDTIQHLKNIISKNNSVLVLANTTTTCNKILFD